MNNFQEKSVFITGANGGLGLETTAILANEGFGRIVMAARTDEKATGARDELVTRIQPTGRIEAAGGFDMTNPQAIERAVEALPKGEAFDVIFFQAGGVIFGKDYQYLNYSGKNIEKTIFQNVVGSYITLVNLEKHGLVSLNARIVFAGGEGARGIPGMIEKPVFDSSEDFRNYIFGNGPQKKYNPMNGIGVSKLVSALLSQKLAQSGDGNEYIWFTPGLTHGTQGLATAAPIQRIFMEKIAFGISGLLGLSQRPQQGAQKYADCLMDKIGKNGDVLGSPEGKVLGEIVDQKPMNPSLTNQELIDEFWSILQTLYPATPKSEITGVREF